MIKKTTRTESVTTERTVHSWTCEECGDVSETENGALAHVGIMHVVNHRVRLDLSDEFDVVVDVLSGGRHGVAISPEILMLRSEDDVRAITAACMEPATEPSPWDGPGNYLVFSDVTFYGDDERMDLVPLATFRADLRSFIARVTNIADRLDEIDERG